jgi:hypothetical protein
MVDTMNNALALVALISLVVLTTPMVTTPMDSVVTLVQIVKSMREMGCKPFIRDQDTKIIGR